MLLITIKEITYDNFYAFLGVDSYIDSRRSPLASPSPRTPHGVHTQTTPRSLSKRQPRRRNEAHGHNRPRTPRRRFFNYFEIRINFLKTGL